MRDSVRMCRLECRCRYSQQISTLSNTLNEMPIGLTFENFSKIFSRLGPGSCKVVAGLSAAVRCAKQRASERARERGSEGGERERERGERARERERARARERKSIVLSATVRLVFV